MQYDAEVLGLSDLAEAMDPIPGDIQISSENEYIVAKGDTLYSLSKKFNTTIENLKIKNNLSDNNLSLGQSIKVK